MGRRWLSGYPVQVQWRDHDTGAGMRPYSMDLRVRVPAAIDAGDSTAEVAEAFTVSPDWVRRLVQRRRETGEVAPRTARDTRVPKPRDHLPPASGSCSGPPRT